MPRLTTRRRGCGGIGIGTAIAIAIGIGRRAVILALPPLPRPPLLLGLAGPALGRSLSLTSITAITIRLGLVGVLGRRASDLPPLTRGAVAAGLGGPLIVGGEGRLLISAVGLLVRIYSFFLLVGIYIHLLLVIIFLLI